MANQNIDKLMAELSQILEQNRQKRQIADATMQGVEQGKQRAAMEQKTTEQLAAARTPILQRSSDKSKLAQASQYDDTGYDKHQNKSYRQDDGLGTKSPNYRAGPGGDGGFGQAFAEAESQQNRSSSYGGDNAYGFGETRPEITGRGHSSEDRVKLAQQYNFLKDNDSPAPPPTDGGALDEQKKRFTQNLMMQRGETGGPLGGAGQPAPVDLQGAAVEAAGNPNMGSFGSDAQTTLGGGQPVPPGAAPAAAMSPGNQQDSALLDALLKRYPG